MKSPFNVWFCSTQLRSHCCEKYDERFLLDIVSVQPLPDICLGWWCEPFLMFDCLTLNRPFLRNSWSLIADQASNSISLEEQTENFCKTVFSFFLRFFCFPLFRFDQWVDVKNVERERDLRWRNMMMNLGWVIEGKNVFWTKRWI